MILYILYIYYILTNKYLYRFGALLGNYFITRVEYLDEIFEVRKSVTFTQHRALLRHLLLWK